MLTLSLTTLALGCGEKDDSIIPDDSGHTDDTDDTDGNPNIIVDTVDACVIPRLSGFIADTDSTLRIVGEGGERLGYDVAFAGDQDGDGVNDLLIGAPGRTGERGAAYLLLSANQGGVHSDSPRVKIEGPPPEDTDQAGDYAQSFGTKLGDAAALFADSGDGPPALIVGAEHQNVDGVEDTGAVYFIPGGLSSDLDLSRTPSSVLRLVGPSANVSWGSHIYTGTPLGSSSASVFLGSIGANVAGLLQGPIEPQDTGALGFRSLDAFTRSDLAPRRGVFADVDGDGQSELIIGDLQGDHDDLNNAGAVHVLRWDTRGSSVGEWRVALSVRGHVPEGYFGAALDVGDLDGDGLDDIAVGAPGPTPSTTTYTGAAWILYGSDLTRGLEDGGSVYAADISPEFVGASGALRAGNNVLVIDDLDGDGADELVITTNDRASGASAAPMKSYLIHGGEDLSGRTLNETEADAWFEGNGYSGYSIADVGDVTGDGCSDIAVGAPYLTQVDGDPESGGVRILSLVEAAATQAGQ